MIGAYIVFVLRGILLVAGLVLAALPICTPLGDEVTWGMWGIAAIFFISSGLIQEDVPEDTRPPENR